jgi:tetratricopeptide (TPR) repeat protein
MSDRKVLIELGQRYVRKGDDQAAISLWTDLLNRDLGARKYLDEAIEMFGLSSHQVPISALLIEYESQERLNWELFDRLTEAYNRVSDISGMIPICQAAWARHSGEAAWLRNKVSGVCTQSGDRDTYLAWKSHAEEHSLEKEKAIVRLVKVFERLGDSDRCIATWEEEVNRDSTSWRCQNELAAAYKRKGDINLEIQGWKNLVNRHPKERWWFERWLAKAYAEKSDCEEAKKRVGRAVK